MKFTLFDLIIAVKIGVAALILGLALVFWQRQRPAWGLIRKEKIKNRQQIAANRKQKLSWKNIPVTVLMDLAAAGINAGSAVPAVLSALGQATDFKKLDNVSRLLLLGAPWEEAWEELTRQERGHFKELIDAFEVAWKDGVSPVPLLAHGVAKIRAERARASAEAAAKLGVQIVLPLGLCFLPAFILIGIVPIVISLLNGGAGLGF